MNSPELENLTLFLNVTDPKGKVYNDYLKIKDREKVLFEIIKNIKISSNDNAKKYYITFNNTTPYLDTLEISKETYDILKLEVLKDE